MRKSDFKNLDNNFLMRWSPRSFDPTPLNKQDLLTIFEAAKWAPSCFNEQPWIFIYADSIKFLEILNEGNQSWAKEAPILVAVFSKRHFDKNGKENRWSDFDCGAAWMSMALQALKLGIYCHGMAGYDVEKAYKICGVDSQKYNSVCMIALGKKASPDNLPGPLKSREVPSERKDIGSFLFEEKFK